VRVILKNSKVVEERQAHMRGGAHEPLTRAEIEEKFRLNCAYGGWPAERSGQFLDLSRKVFDVKTIELSAFRG